MMKRKSHTLVGRLLVYVLIVNSVMMMILGLSATAISANKLCGEVAGSMEKVLAQTNKVLDTYLIDLRSRLVKLAESQSVINCLSMHSPSYSSTLLYERDIQSQLSGIDLFNPIKDVLILGNNGYVYNLNKRSNLIADYDFTACDWYRQAIGVKNGVFIQMLPLHAQDFYNPSVELAQAHEKTFSLSMAVHSRKDYRIIGAVVCNFKIQSLAQILQDGNFEENGNVVLIDGDRRICLNSDDADLGEFFSLSEKGLLELSATNSGHFWETIGGKKVLLCFDKLSLTDWKLIYYIPVESLLTYFEPLIHILAVVLMVCLALNIVISFMYVRSVRKPISKLIQSVSQVDMDQMCSIPVRTEYLELEQLSVQFNRLLSQLDRLIQKDYRSQIELSRFELSALRAQINPHFLFNTLQLLQTEIVYGNIEKSNRIILSLSQLLRYYITDAEAYVTVAQEMEYLNKYLLLFTSKYDGRMKTVLTMTDEVKELLMPKLLLQPVAENSIRHAVDISDNVCTISIHASLQADRLQIEIADDGCGIENEKLEIIRKNLSGKVDWTKDSIGLANVHQRIQTLFGTQYGLSIFSGSRGTKVLLAMPVVRDTRLPEISDKICMNTEESNETACR